MQACATFIVGQLSSVGPQIGTMMEITWRVSLPFCTGDGTPPFISGCPNSLTRNIQQGVGSTIVNWVPPQSTDNSGTSTLVQATHQPNTLFSVGVTAVSYVYTDPSGNFAVCTFYVTVTCKYLKLQML